MRALDLAMAHDVGDIFDRMLLAVLIKCFGSVGGRISASVIGNALKTAPRKKTDLILPVPIITRELMDEHNGCSGACDFDIQLDAIGVGEIHGGGSVDAREWAMSWRAMCWVMPAVRHTNRKLFALIDR